MAHETFIPAAFLFGKPRATPAGTRPESPCEVDVEGDEGPPFHPADFDELPIIRTRQRLPRHGVGIVAGGLFEISDDWETERAYLTMEAK